jgi:predicted ArsR family transcriptional regulator
MNDTFFGRRKSAANLSNAEKIARRANAIKRFRELLAVRPMTVNELAEVVELPPNTVYQYLCQMAEDGEAQRQGEGAIGRRTRWVLGAGGGERDESHAPRAHGAVIVPAVQMGMTRDPWDVALFGPARGAAA